MIIFANNKEMYKLIKECLKNEDCDGCPIAAFHCAGRCIGNVLAWNEMGNNITVEDEKMLVWKLPKY